MADKNLSQFVELSTAPDAGDWTFIWDTSANVSKKITRANWLKGDITTTGTVTAASFVGSGAGLDAATTTVAGVMSAADKVKLNGIAAGAGVTVNADWNSTTGASQILNKPTLGTAAALSVGTTSGTVAAGDDIRLTNTRTPTAHAATHQAGGTDSIKLDDLVTPDDNTDLDATTGRHGLLPKLGGGTTNFLRADGTWAAPTAQGSTATPVTGPYVSSHDDERGAVGAWSFNPAIAGGTYFTKISIDPHQWVSWSVAQEF